MHTWGRNMKNFPEEVLAKLRLENRNCLNQNESLKKFSVFSHGTKVGGQKTPSLIVEMAAYSSYAQCPQAHTGQGHQGKAVNQSE